MRLLAALAVCLIVALPAPAADISSPVNAAANIGALAKLILTPRTLAFPDADPDSVPLIPASTGPIAITAKARTLPGMQVRLTLLATDDMRSGLDTVSIDALRWTAAGSGFQSGTASRTTAQTVGTWIDSGVRTGSQSFVIANTWERVPGSYSVTLVYTLSAQ